MSHLMRPHDLVSWEREDASYTLHNKHDVTPNAIEDAPDRLVQLAVLHAEFEALHPFLDGNGRLGRMLVPLFMAKNDLLSQPMFYISAFFERNRDEYYERLPAVSRDGNWTQWIAFFLKSIVEQARENQSRAETIRALYDETVHRIAEISHSQYAVHATDFLFQHPMFKASDFYKSPDRTPEAGGSTGWLVEVDPENAQMSVGVI